MESRINLDIWLGPILLGSSLNIFLLGFVITQTHQYFTTKHKDKLWIKLLVCWVLMMEILTALIDIFLVWHFCITSFGAFQALATPLWAYNMVPTMVSSVSLPVQLFFARRVMILTRNIWFGCLIGFAAGIIFICTLGLTICDQLIVDFATRYPSAIRIVSTLGISLHLANDLAISTSLVWYLHSHRTGLERSDALITDIIRLTVQTGAVTVVAVTYVLVLMEVATFNFARNNTSAVLYLPLSKFYSLSFLVALNARGGWRFGFTDDSLGWNSGRTTTQQAVRESGSAHNHISLHDMQRRDMAGDDPLQYSPTTQQSFHTLSKANVSRGPRKDEAPSVVEPRPISQDETMPNSPGL